MSKPAHIITIYTAQAKAKGAQAEQLEALAESRRAIRLPAPGHPHHASFSRLIEQGKAAAEKAARLRSEIQAVLSVVTQLTDYSFPSHHKDRQWEHNLELLSIQAKEAEKRALSHRQVLSLSRQSTRA